MSTPTLPIRIAVIGGMRGQSFARGTIGQEDRVKLSGICDINPDVLEKWKKHDGIKTYTNYEQVLNDDDIDAVCIATPVPLHGRQSIDAINAGKHVLCEVTAGYDIDEYWELIEAVNRTGKTYMMAENYCYARDVLMVQEMVKKSVFGELITAEGAYIHDCRHLMFYEDNTLTWRGNLRKHQRANNYPTHSLGPVAFWLDINRSDKFATTASWESPALCAAEFVRRNLGEDHEMAAPGAWRMPDTIHSLIKTEKGVLIQHRIDHSTPRPHHMNRYALQGTKASFTSPIDAHDEPLIWIQDRSPTKENGLAQSWEPLYKYAEEFEHPLWREFGNQAKKAGHGGGDFFQVREFANAIIEERSPEIDVYDAVTWSCISPLSKISLEENNRSVDVPDFKNGKKE